MAKIIQMQQPSLSEATEIIIFIDSSFAPRLKISEKTDSWHLFMPTLSAANTMLQKYAEGYKRPIKRL